MYGFWYNCLSPMHASNGSQAGLWTTKKQSCCSFCRWLCETNGLAEISQISNQSGLLASYPWAWLMFLGMSIRLSAWGFGVAHGSYSGDEAGDLTGISFGESVSNLMDSLALGIAGPSGKLALLDSLKSLVVASGSTVSAMAAGFCCLFGLQLVYI